MAARTVEVPVELGGRLLDAVVRELFELPWNQARRAIETGKVRYDGRVVVDPTRKVRPKAEVAYDPAARRPRPDTDLEPERLVFVDNHVVVVDKPSGISTIPYEKFHAQAGTPVLHGPGLGETGTLDVRVQAALKARGGPREIGVVHRIDKETSGLLVFTRSWLGKQKLAAQFRAHTVQRRYLALVHGTVRAARYESHIMEDRGDGVRGSWEARPRKGKPTGQHAVTHVRPLETLHGATLVECRLETGRTHQIRIHLSEAGHPLLGERVYIRNFRGPELPSPRLMLHAATLGFLHPVDDQEVSFDREPPQDFQDLLAQLRVAELTPVDPEERKPSRGKPSAGRGAGGKAPRGPRRGPR